MKHLSPRSALALWETHSKLLDPQSKEMLFKLVNFEIEEGWQLSSTIVPVNADDHKHITDNNSKTANKYAYEKKNPIYSNEIQADSKAVTERVIPFSIISLITFLFIFM